jgi:hypothetical protein
MMALVEINAALFYSLHRPFIGFDLLVGMQTLLTTRNEGTRATWNSNVLVVQLNECGLAM